jgi:ribose transport system permease protein
MPETNSASVTDTTGRPAAHSEAHGALGAPQPTAVPTVDLPHDELRARPTAAALKPRLNLAPRRVSAVYLWIGFVILFGLLEPGVYLSSVTLQLIFSEGAVTCLVALAFLVPLIAGAYDLSVGAVMATSVVMATWLQLHTSLPPALGAIICVAVCTLFGGISGFVIVRLKVNSFIATLGMSQALLAVILLISHNSQLVANFPSSWSNLGLNKILGVPLVDVYLVAIACVLWYVLEHTRVGRYLAATGGNPEAARLAGVPTDRMVWGALAASGAIAGIAGVIYGMRVGTFDATVGPGYLFPAVTAVFLGASQLSQRPNVWGTLIAYFALAFGIQGLALASSSAAVWSQPLFQGIALILAVAMTNLPALRRRAGRAQRRLNARGQAAAAPEGESS